MTGVAELGDGGIGGGGVYPIQVTWLHNQDQLPTVEHINTRYTVTVSDLLLVVLMNKYIIMLQSCLCVI